MRHTSIDSQSHSLQISSSAAHRGGAIDQLIELGQLGERELTEPLVRQLVARAEQVTDLVEAEPDPLGSVDDRQPPEHVGSIPPLAGDAPGRRQKTAGLVERIREAVMPARCATSPIASCLPSSVMSPSILPAADDRGHPVDATRGLAGHDRDWPVRQLAARRARPRVRRVMTICTDGRSMTSRDSGAPCGTSTGSGRRRTSAFWAHGRCPAPSGSPAPGSTTPST